MRAIRDRRRNALKVKKRPKKADPYDGLTVERCDHRLPELDVFFALVKSGAVKATASDGGKDSIRTYIRQTMLADPFYWFMWDADKDRAYTKELVRLKGNSKARFDWLAKNWPARHEYELIVEEVTKGD